MGEIFVVWESAETLQVHHGMLIALLELKMIQNVIAVDVSISAKMTSIVQSIA